MRTSDGSGAPGSAGRIPGPPSRRCNTPRRGDRRTAPPWASYSRHMPRPPRGPRTPDGSTIVATRHMGGRRRKAAGIAFGGLMSAGAMGLVTSAGPAHAGNGAVFTLGVLTVIGDAQDNALTISRDAAGKILVNGGTVAV